MASNHLKRIDPEIADILSREEVRQRQNLELIASENIVSDGVLEAMGSILTNKYAEGYPNRRYYGGCEVVDEAETLAIERVKQLFDCEYANVQPHSGSSANMELYGAVLKEGDTILGLDLSHGGHLTHGSPVNFSGKTYRFISYGVSPESEQIDYDALEEVASKEKPKAIIAGASAYPRRFDFSRMREIADSVGAFLITDMAHYAGLIAADLYPNPLPHSHFVTSTTHKTLRGPRGGIILMHRDAENTIGVVAPKSQRVKKWSEVINSQVFPGMQGGPLMHVIAAKAVAFKEALDPSFKEYQRQVLLNANSLASGLMERGINLVSGGTDSHILLANLTSLEITGKEAQLWLDEAGITVNKNTIPFEPLSPMVTSGIRLGTPSLTTRGMKESQMEEISGYIVEVLKSKGEKASLVREQVLKLTEQFPLFQK